MEDNSWEEEWGLELYNLFHRVARDASAPDFEKDPQYSKKFKDLRFGLLSKKADVNVHDRNRSTPLLVAIFYKNEELIDLLLDEFGANVSLEGERRFPSDTELPIHVAASVDTVYDPTGAYSRILTRLLDKGADPNAKTRKGRTPLQNAYYRSIEGVKILLSRGANPNTKLQSEGNKTVLHIAADRMASQINAGGDPELEKLRVLFRYGANANIQDDTGKTPLNTFFSKNYSFPNYYPQVITKERIQTFLSNGADPTIKDNEGKSALDRTPPDFVPLYTEFLQKRGAVEQVASKGNLAPDVKKNILKFAELGGRRSRLHKKTRRSKGKRGHTKRR